MLRAVLLLGWGLSAVAGFGMNPEPSDSPSGIEAPAPAADNHQWCRNPSDFTPDDDILIPGCQGVPQSSCGVGPAGAGCHWDPSAGMIGKCICDFITNLGCTGLGGTEGDRIMGKCGDQLTTTAPPFPSCATLEGFPGFDIVWRTFASCCGNGESRCNVPAPPT